MWFRSVSYFFSQSVCRAGSISKGAIIFFWIGRSCKSWGHRIFSWEIGGSQKNQEIIGWLQILMKILFNEIAQKCIFSALRALGVTCFFQHCSSGGGHKIFDHQIGGSQKYCQGTFRNSWPPIPKKMVGP